MNKLLAALVVMCIAFYQTTYGERYLKISKLECEPNFKYLNYLNCSLKPINRYKTISKIDGELKVTVRNATVSLGLFRRNDANRFIPHMVNFTNNFCRAMSGPTYGVYLNILKSILTKYTNLNHSCPYSGPIQVRDLYIDPRLFQIRMAYRSYKFMVKLYEGYPLDCIASVAYYADYIDTAEKFGK